MIKPNRCDRCRAPGPLPLRLEVRAKDEDGRWPAWVLCSWECLLAVAEAKAGRPAIRPTGAT